MRRNEFLSIALVCAAGLSGCKPNTVKLLYIADQSKVVLHPDEGTVLTWATANGNAVPVKFPFGNPCKATDPVGQCTINVPSARVPYDCPGCADPEIVVGSDISIFKEPTAGVGSGQPPAATVYMGCVNNAVAIFPSEAKISRAVVSAGATILWVPGGLPPVGPDWKADGFSNAICSNGPPFNQTTNSCSLKTDAPVGPTTYTVSSAACNNTSVPGTITITP